MANRWVNNRRRGSARSRSARRKRAREGNVAILTALMLTLMTAFVALSFDIGNLYHVRTEVQSGVDAAALAGASALDGTANGKALAEWQAIEFGKKNRVYNKSQMPLSSSDLKFGHWDFETKHFDEDKTGTNFGSMNALRVKYTEPVVSLPFAAVMGQPSAPVMTYATAVGGGPADAECGFPMVIPQCALTNADVNGLCQYCMQMQDNNNDTIGWTGFDKPANKNNIYDAIAAACLDVNGNVAINKKGECDGQCIRRDRVQQQDGIQVQNGNLVNTGKGSFCELIKTIINRDGTPKPFTVTVPVIDAGGAGNCGGAQLSGTKSLVGYAQLDIFSAKCGNADGNPANATPANLPGGLQCNPPPSQKYFTGMLHCTNAPTGDHAGGVFNGVSGQPRLVE
jgi:hypothetical protein